MTFNNRPLFLSSFCLVIASSAQPCACHLNFPNKTWFPAGSLEISTNTIFLDLPLVEGWDLTYTRILPKIEPYRWRESWNDVLRFIFWVSHFAYFVCSLCSAVLWRVWMTWVNSRISQRHHFFPHEVTSEKRAQNFHTDDASLPRCE